MDNLSVLTEAKREYIGQLCHLMCPVMIETFDKLYEESYTMSNGRKVLVMFQKLLKEVPNWSDAMSKQHTDNIANRCAWFNDLLAAVFVSCVKILSSVRLGKDNKKISLKLPSNEVFIQTCYNNVARDLYKDPYIFSESQNEHTRNDKLFDRFTLVIEASVRELIPVQQILQTYMSNEKEDIDVGGEDTEDTEDPEFVDEYPPEPEPETHPEPELAEGGSMEEPMAEMQPPEQESSPFDNEFKTVNTSGGVPQQMMEEEEDEEPVLFPDASDAPVKKVGYS